MNDPGEPNVSAYTELIHQIGLDYLVGIPDDLMEYLRIISQDYAFVADEGYGDCNHILEEYWNFRGPEKAVEESLLVWVENVKQNITADVILWTEYPRYNRDLLDSIADRVKLKNRQELIDRLVVAAKTPKA